MFSVKGFADGGNVDHCSGSAVIAIAGNVIAAIIAVAKRGENKGEMRTCVTEKPLKEDSIKEIGKKPIVSD
jgi:hypothetical protein